MFRYRIILSFFFIAISGCTEIKRNKLVKEIQTGDRDKIITAAFEMGEAKDTFYIKYLMQQPDDPRITHMLRFKGMSVYQQKIGSLYKITGIRRPDGLNRNVDSTVIEFWRNKYPQYYTQYREKRH